MRLCPSTFKTTVWYTNSMLNFGKGPTLREASEYLRDDAERHRLIVDIAERDSVIEGLPPFTAEIRSRILEQLKKMNGHAQERTE